MKKTATISTVSYIGKKMTFTCTVGKRGRLDKLCLEDVVGDDVSFEHMWVHRCKRFKNLMLLKGQRIELTAVLTEYIGLEEGSHNVIRKIGLETARNIRRI